MRFIFLVIFLTISLNAQKVLVLNSNKDVEKYISAQKAFGESFKDEFEVLDISNMSKKKIKNYLYSEYPDIVYAIGTKAYKYTNMFIPEKAIFFSSIVNYKRLDVKGKKFGISNELHSGMNLTLIKSLFNKTNTLAIIYSRYTKDLFESFKENAKKMGLNIQGQEISKGDEIEENLLKKSDGLIIISDPILLKDEKRVLNLFNRMKELKKPIFAYHNLFLKFGATLAISADDSTIGRQMSLMISNYLKKKNIEKIQIPMGTHVVFNKKVADKFNYNYNKNSLSIVNKVIE